MKLEEYQTAKIAFEAGGSLAPEDSRFANFIRECDERIAGMSLLFPFIGMILLFPSVNSKCLSP